MGVGCLFGAIEIFRNEIVVIVARHSEYAGNTKLYAANGEQYACKFYLNLKKKVDVARLPSNVPSKNRV